jgi:hypothetical protein
VYCFSLFLQHSPAAILCARSLVVDRTPSNGCTKPTLSLDVSMLLPSIALELKAGRPDVRSVTERAPVSVSPMMILARWIKHALDVPVQRSQGLRKSLSIAKLKPVNQQHFEQFRVRRNAHRPDGAWV